MGRPAQFRTKFLDQIKDVSITDLKKWGMLPGYLYSTITWNKFGHEIAGIGLKVDTRDTDNAHVEFIYSIKDQDIRFKVPLVKVPSNLGTGYRWYFYCPVAKKRCMKLYENGLYFTHREAIPNAMYSIQAEKKRGRDIGRFFSWNRKLDKLNELDKKPYSKIFYRGKPTVRFKRWQKLTRKVQRLIPSADMITKCFRTR